MKVSGPLVVATGLADANMSDVVRVGPQRLIGEILTMKGDSASIQVYEETSGLGPGAEVVTTGAPMSVELGPGIIENIYDGIQRPLEGIMRKAGNNNLPRGVEVPALDREKKWDFRAVVEEWNKLDRNRERRERDHENLRGDVPLEYQAVPEPKLIPRWMNNPAYRQLMAGDFLDVLFDCPYEMHNLTADAFVSRMVEELSEEHKEVLYFLSLRLYSTTRLAAVRGQSDRNIRKLRKTIHKKLQRQMYDHLCGKQEHGGSLTLRERQFLEEYSKIARKQGKDAVIRRENKSKRRKKKNRP